MILPERHPRSDQAAYSLNPSNAASTVNLRKLEHVNQVKAIESKIKSLKKKTDEFEKMGYGVSAYFRFVCQMILLFLILIVIAFPTTWMFNDFDGGDRKE